MASVIVTRGSSRHSTNTRPCKPLDAMMPSVILVLGILPAVGAEAVLPPFLFQGNRAVAQPILAVLFSNVLEPTTSDAAAGDVAPGGALRPYPSRRRKNGMLANRALMPVELTNFRTNYVYVQTL
jgi:hypothetical protein